MIRGSLSPQFQLRDEAMAQRIHLRLAAFATAVAVIACCALSDTGLLLFVLGFIIWGLYGLRSWHYLRTVAWATTALILPLILIHAYLNPAFHHPPYIEVWKFGLSIAGLRYAVAITLNITALISAGFIWQYIPSGSLIDDALSLGVPARFSLLIVHAVALAREIPRRAHRVMIAQQTRGLPVYGTWFNRIRALPAVLVPVVASILADAVGRSEFLYGRGFGVTAIASPAPRAWRGFDRITVLYLLTLVLLGRLISGF